MICEKIEIGNIFLEVMKMTEELKEFIETNRDARELKRGVSVQMYLEGYKHWQIKDILGVGSGYISKWVKMYVDKGLEGLLLGYKGKASYLSEMQNQAINAWLQAKTYWNLVELQEYIEDEYNVVFESKQSYYAIFEKAGISWKKTQKHNPKGDPTIIQKKKDEITEWLEKHRSEILAEKLVVFFADECHLLWGDICGYVWGKKQERIEIPITNEKERQTYYGAVNLYTQECVIQAASAGNSESTVAFLKYLQSQNENKQIAMIWDGAS
jgi:putative transposase